MHDADSPVALRDIRFTLVLNEEHDAYAIFQQNVTKILLNEDVQLPSLLPSEGAFYLAGLWVQAAQYTQI